MKNQNYVFRFKDEVIKYCMNDVLVLSKGVTAFRDIVISACNLDPYDNGTCTISSSLRIFLLLSLLLLVTSSPAIPCRFLFFLQNSSHVMKKKFTMLFFLEFRGFLLLVATEKKNDHFIFFCKTQVKMSSQNDTATCLEVLFRPHWVAAGGLLIAWGNKRGEVGYSVQELPRRTLGYNENFFIMICDTITVLKKRNSELELKIISYTELNHQK